MGGRPFALAAAAWSGSFLAWWSFTAALVVLITVAIPTVILWRKYLLLVVILLALVAGAVTASLARSGAQPPSSVVGERAHWTVRTTSVIKPIQARAGQPIRVMLTATTTSYRLGSRSVAVSLPVRIFAVGSDIPNISVGARVTFLGRITQLPPGKDRAALSALGSMRLVATSGPVLAAVAPLREALDRSTSSASAEPASLVAGLAIGDESRQSPQFAQVMQRTGLSHLTAVSGGNVAIVLAASLLLAFVARLGPVTRVGCAAVVLLGYVILVGPQPSVLRAAVMGGVALAGVVLGGAPRGLPLVSSCVLVLVLAAPALAVSLGFALSVVATAALIAAAGPLAVVGRRLMGLRRVPEVMILAGTVTIAAQAATAPLLFAIGAPVSWVSVPANLAAAPLVAPITVLGLLTAVIGAVEPTVGTYLGAMAVWFAKGLVGIAHWGDAHSSNQVLPASILAGLSIIWLLRFISTRVTKSRFIIFVVVTSLVIAMGFGWRWYSATQNRATDWRIIVCDVGQGAAVLLRDGSQAAVLVDVGSRDSGILRCLNQSGVERLTKVVVTHFHEDHYGGLAEVIRHISVSQILVPPTADVDRGKQQVDSIARQHSVPVGYLAAGDQWEMSSAAAQVIWPVPHSSGVVGGDKDNNSSIVLRAQWRDGFSVLTTGDIEPEAQARIRSTYPQQSHDVVVVPHHGSPNQDPRFAQWAGGKIAIVSTGPNSYGHPATETKEEYEDSGAIWLRTDQLGTAAVSVTESRLRLSRMD